MTKCGTYLKQRNNMVDGWDTGSLQSKELKSAYYIVNFERNDKILYSEIDSEQSSVYTSVNYIIKFKNNKTLMYAFNRKF